MKIAKQRQQKCKLQKDSRLLLFRGKGQVMVSASARVLIEWLCTIVQWEQYKNIYVCKTFCKKRKKIT